MQRTRILIALCAALLPAIALAAGQHPSATASEHPATSAHANAVAGEADAARIEACARLASDMISDLEKGNAKAATANFDATMHADLDADKLGTVWQQVGAQMGKLQGRGAAQNMIYQDHAVITLPLRFEKGDVNAQVACDADGKVAGFFLRPGAAPSGSAPASSD